MHRSTRPGGVGTWKHTGLSDERPGRATQIRPSPRMGMPRMRPQGPDDRSGDDAVLFVPYTGGGHAAGGRWHPARGTASAPRRPGRARPQDSGNRRLGDRRGARTGRQRAGCRTSHRTSRPRGWRHRSGVAGRSRCICRRAACGPGPGATGRCRRRGRFRREGKLGRATHSAEKRPRPAAFPRAPGQTGPPSLNGLGSLRAKKETRVGPLGAARVLTPRRVSSVAMFVGLPANCPSRPPPDAARLRKCPLCRSAPEATAAAATHRPWPPAWPPPPHSA